MSCVTCKQPLYVLLYGGIGVSYIVKPNWSCDMVVSVVNKCIYLQKNIKISKTK